jgi:polyisoprenoid-binding protein YceI
VALDMAYGGQILDPVGPGSFRAGFTAQTTLSRKEFAMTYNPLLATVGAIVSNAIKTVIHVEAVRQG